ncbi:MAG: hypothetical protein ACTSRS_13195 [Candidatus Helarchaeota archaeon]
MIGILIILLLLLIGWIGTSFFYYRRIQVLQDLCELRRNATTFYRIIFHDYKVLYHKLTRDVDTALKGAQILVQRFLRLRLQNLRLNETVTRASRKIEKMQEVNESLALEFAKVLQQNHVLEKEVTRLQERLVEMDRLAERNEELEYALNLESISMLEKYQSQDKLFNAIEDVRRSLTRILNPA